MLTLLEADLLTTNLRRKALSPDAAREGLAEITREIGELQASVYAGSPHRTYTPAMVAIEILHALAPELFARVRGWKLSRRSFTLRALSLGMVWGRGSPNEVYERPYTVMNHQRWYRLDRRPIAIASQPYDFDPAAADAWCARWELAWHEPTDVRSWWCPGRTRLILIHRA